MGSGCIDPYFLDLGTSWRWVVSKRPPSCFNPGERVSSTHWIGSWVSLRSDLDDLEKRKFLALPRLELRPFHLPAHSQLVYWLYYPISSLLYYTPTKSSLHFDISFAAFMTEPALYRLLTFHIPNLMSIFLSLGHLFEESIQFWGPCDIS
jgi:hypothetical protein